MKKLFLEELKTEIDVLGLKADNLEDQIYDQISLEDAVSSFNENMFDVLQYIENNLSLSGAVLMILYQHRGYDYPGMMIYVMALYTFYALTMSIVDIVKYQALFYPELTHSAVSTAPYSSDG